MRFDRESYRLRHHPLNKRLWITWAFQAGLLILLLLLLPEVAIEQGGYGLITVATVGLVNAAIRPLLVALSLRPSLLLFLPLALMANAGLLSLAASAPGISVEGGWPLALLVVIMALANVSLSNLLAIDDDDAYFHHLLKPIVKQSGAGKHGDDPGVIFLEIDGLAEPILRRAIEAGQMPTLARWLASGSHKLAAWECDLSSQTSASQAGILLGSNFDIPAFRWYEKEQGRLMVSNHPADAVEIERRLSTGDGLLARGGTSRSNVFSGDAPQTIFTFSTIADAGRHSTRPFYPLLVGPTNFLRILVLFLWDRWLERRAARYQGRHDVRPRMDRSGIYPWVRAATTVILRELNQYVVMGDIFAGIPCIYTTYFGYDEVAHHSGIERPDALAVLHQIDAQFDRLDRAVQLAPRPYHLVVLSDHGQSQGATFEQRYGMSLADLVRCLTLDHHSVEALQYKHGGWGKASVVLTDLLNDIIPADDGIISRLVRRAVRDSTHVVGELDPAMPGRQRVFVELRSDRRKPGQTGEDQKEDPAELVVLASGNLGLIYCTRWAERLSLERIDEHFPGLIQGLARHEGIAFLLVRSEANGPLAIGGDGIHYLGDGRVEGRDPLAHFSAHAAAHLLRSDGFPHVADILVNSVYDHSRDEVAAFEALVGSHGGLGGMQTQPFLLYPAQWQLAEAPIVGAEQLHKQLKRWLQHAGQGAAMAT